MQWPTRVFVETVDGEIVEIDDTDDNLGVDELRSAVAKRVDTLCSEQLVLVSPVTWNGETGPDEVYAMANAGFVLICTMCSAGGLRSLNSPGS